jgi:hypothetical protein
MGLEEELANQISQDIARTIDQGVLADILVSCGWTRVKDQYYHHRSHAVDIADWLEEHCQGQHRRLASDWLFKDAKDATAYILRWQ